jgi:MoaA/NifB/PqqE/SkfB family radical SAM enzyme
MINPVVLVLPIIDNCQGKCHMCGIWRSIPRKPLNADMLQKILSDKSFSTSLSYINLTGGEPFLHPELSSFAKCLSVYCPNLREVSINTSGLVPKLCQEKTLDFYKNLLFHVKLIATVSVDGTEQIHDKIRGVRGAFKLSLETLTRLRDLSQCYDNFEVQANLTISNINYKTIEDVIELFENIGINFSITYATTNDLYLKNTEFNKKFELNINQKKDLITLVERLINGNFRKLSNTNKHYLNMLKSYLKNQIRMGPCIFQTKGIFLDLDGMLYPCGSVAKLSYGNLYKYPFKKVFARKKVRYIREKLQKQYCDNCISNSYHGLNNNVWLDALKAKRKSNVSKKEN